MKRNLTWRDLYVGWPSQAYALVRAGWYNVFETAVGERLFFSDSFSADEVRSLREARQELATRTQSDRVACGSDPQGPRDIEPGVVGLFKVADANRGSRTQQLGVSSEQAESQQDFQREKATETGVNS